MSKLRVDDGEKKRDEEVEGIHLVLDIAVLKNSLSPFQLSRENTKSFTSSKEKRYVVVLLSGSDGNMEIYGEV